MASDDDEDQMIGINREGLEQAVRAVGAGSAPVCVATEVAEAIAGIGDVEQDLEKVAAQYGCELLPSHILHKGDLVPAHIFMKKMK
jgi:hypothetical protein